MATKGIFLDVDSSIVENNLRITNNPDEDELSKVLQPFGDHYPSRVVKPYPGFCIKTKEVGTDTKVFVNVCQTDAIPAPADITELELSELDDNENSPYRVPMSIYEIQQSTDNKGEVAKVCDVAIHPDFFKKVQNIQKFKTLFITIIFEALNDKYGIICVDEKVILKNRKVFGTLQTHRIQQRDIQQKMGNSDVLLSDGNENRPNKPLIETISSNEGTVGTKEPEYRLFRRKTQPNCLIGEFKFPDIISAKQLIVDVGEDRIVIESPSKNYLLDIFIPHLIRQNSCSSAFNKTTKILTLTMPLIGG